MFGTLPHWGKLKIEIKFWNGAQRSVLRNVLAVFVMVFGNGIWYFGIIGMVFWLGILVLVFGIIVVGYT